MNTPNRIIPLPKMTTNNRLIHFIKEHEPDMFDLLEKMVLIQSGSHNKEGVDWVPYHYLRDLK
jgi:hypothetical protein